MFSTTGDMFGRYSGKWDGAANVLRDVRKKEMINESIDGSVKNGLALKKSKKTGCSCRILRRKWLLGETLGATYLVSERKDADFDRAF
jgi:hypothetical protein